MGASESKQVDPGIVTVATAGDHARRSAAAGADSDALLSHLLALRSLVPDVETRVAKSDPSSVWRDIESAKQLGADTRELSGALEELLGSYHAWHAEVRWARRASWAAASKLLSRQHLGHSGCLQGV